MYIVSSHIQHNCRINWCIVFSNNIYRGCITKSPIANVGAYLFQPTVICHKVIETTFGVGECLENLYKDVCAWDLKSYSCVFQLYDDRLSTSCSGLHCKKCCCISTVKCAGNFETSTFHCRFTALLYLQIYTILICKITENMLLKIKCIFTVQCRVH